MHHERVSSPIWKNIQAGFRPSSTTEAFGQSRTPKFANNYFERFGKLCRRRRIMRERLSIEIFALFIHWAHSSQPVRPSCAGCSRRSFTTSAATAAPFAFSAMPSGAVSAPEPVTDRNGAVVTMDSWLKSHVTDVPDLVLGLDGEPHFLLTVATGDERNVQPYALRAECTHLGCLVQPDPLTGGFACPCHGSRCEFPCKPVVSLPSRYPELHPASS